MTYGYTTLLPLDQHTRCTNGLYVSHDHRCDGWVDCKDSQTDEQDCPCDLQRDFMCENTRCIHKANQCDGVCDCQPQCDDEVNCSM